MTMTPCEMELAIDTLNSVVLALNDRIDALEAGKPEPLTFPVIDLGLIPGTGPEPKHPFEPFFYTERS
jgi:hypothetical protein